MGGKGTILQANSNGIIAAADKPVTAPNGRWSASALRHQIADFIELLRRILFRLVYQLWRDIKQDLLLMYSYELRVRVVRVQREIDGV
jgi:hypothetical protein